MGALAYLLEGTGSNNFTLALILLLVLIIHVRVMSCTVGLSVGFWVGFTDIILYMITVFKKKLSDNGEGSTAEPVDDFPVWLYPIAPWRARGHLSSPEVVLAYGCYISSCLFALLLGWLFSGIPVPSFIATSNGVEMLVLAAMLAFISCGGAFLFNQVIPVTHSRGFMWLSGWRDWGNWWRGLVGGVAVFGLALLIMAGANALSGGTGANNSTMYTVGNLGVVAGFFAIVILSPLSEELIFRGIILQLSLTVSKVRPWMLIVSQALLFALVHGVTFTITGAALIIYLFVIGAVLGYLSYKRASLVPSLIAHSTFNFLVFAVQVYSSGVLG